MSVSPSVSVVIPTRDRPDLVARAILSALAQTHTDLEVVVIVDGPDAATTASLADIDDPRLRVIDNPTSLGGAAARNVGVQAARGTWIAFLDDDDEWLATKLARQLDDLDADPYEISICQAIVRSPSDEFVWPRRSPDAGEPISEYLFVRRGLFAGEGAIQTSMIVASRSLLLEVPFDASVPRYQEADWVLRAAAHGAHLRLVLEPLTVWNVGDGRVSITARHEGDWDRALRWIKQRRSLVTPRAYASFILVNVSSVAATAGDRSAMAGLWREAWRHGRPGTLDVLLFAGKALIPPALRANLRRRFSGGTPRERRSGIVVAWMPHSQRTTTLADRLGYAAVLYGRRGFRRPWTALLTYPWLMARTMGLLLRQRPPAVIVVAPPFVAPLIALPIARVLRIRMAVDIHSGALLDGRWRWSAPILAWVSAQSATAIVTLESLAVRLRRRRARALVLPDPLPRVEPVSRAGSRTEVVMICGWGDDEPIEMAVEAARGENWNLAITGRPRGRKLDLPPNVRLTGFLSDEEYGRLIGEAAAIVVLTTRDQTLLSGAWEALAHRRPMVLSNTPALQATFGPTVTYVDPRSADVQAGVRSVLADPGAEREAARLGRHFATANDTAIAELRTMLAKRHD